MLSVAFYNLSVDPCEGLSLLTASGHMQHTQHEAGGLWVILLSDFGKDMSLSLHTNQTLTICSLLISISTLSSHAEISNPFSYLSVG